MVSSTILLVWCYAQVWSQLGASILTRTLLRPISPDSIFIRFLEVAFCSKKPNFIQAAVRDLTKTFHFLSKHVMSVLSGVLLLALRYLRYVIASKWIPRVNFIDHIVVYRASMYQRFYRRQASGLQGWVWTAFEAVHNAGSNTVGNAVGNADACIISWRRLLGVFFDS